MSEAATGTEEKQHGIYAEGDARAPRAEAATDEMKVTITAKAAEKAKLMLAKRGTPHAAVRLGIKGGGCTGLAYVLEFDDRPPRATDRVFEMDGFRVFVDPKSLVYLNGTVLDWKETLMKNGFELVNPNEKKSCGCGESFSV
jgi:iron-sulfur cluster assembly protein